MSFNRKFNTNVWENQRPVHPIPPFVNNPPNFFQNLQNQGNFQYQNINQHFQQHQNQNIRPLLSLPLASSLDQPSQQFRKFNNNNNHNPDYRRPGPACSRNNNFGNNSGRWNKNRNNDRGEDFNSRNNLSNNRLNQGANDAFDSRNNNNRIQPRIDFEQPPPEKLDGLQFKSLVEQLKAVHNSKKNEQQSDSGIDEICAKNASEASKKLLTQLKTMDKDGVRDLINNPKQPYKKKVLNIQAREKLREQMRRKLKILGDDENPEYQFEPDECIDYERIPEALISEIGKTIEMGLDNDGMDLSESNGENNEDRDIEVVTKNLGSDFLMGSEMLLMNGFSLLGDDGDSEIKALEANVPKVPPLPADSGLKPPSPPPEPVPAPPSNFIPAPVKPPPEKAIFCSVDKPWEPIPPSFNSKFAEDKWDIESSRNPDPPSNAPTKEQEKQPKSDKLIGISQSSVSEKQVSLPAPNEPDIKPVVTPAVESPVVKPTTALVKASDDDRDMPEESSTLKKQTDEQPSEEGKEGKRANETYGEYRRRLASEREANISNPNNTESNESDRQQNNNNTQQRNHQSFSSGRGGSNSRSEAWMSNNRRHNNQNNNNNNSNFNDLKNQSRQSRYENDRVRDRNSFQQHNDSRDRHNSRDNVRQRSEDARDGHNYRFQKENISQEPTLDQLNTLLNPKPLHFKGSFNTRAGYSNYNGSQRSRSRNRTPVNNSMERDLDINLLPPANDARPCYYTLKKVMEIDAEMSRVHEKIHGIDKVISNLQLERIAHQKTLTKLQHDRKILFDNLVKRAMTNADGDKEVSERQSKEIEPQPSTSKSQIEKKLQHIVDQKKRKHDEQVEEPKKKKPAIEVEMETTSAAEKAAKIKKEREEEERRQQAIERKRIKKLRKQREEAEKSRLEEKIRQEAQASTTITVKQEPKEKQVEKSKSPKNHNRQHSEKHVKPDKAKQSKKVLFTQSEIMQIENFTTKKFSVELKKGKLMQSQLEHYQSSNFIEIDSTEWASWLKSPKTSETKAPETIVKSEVKSEAEAEKSVKAKASEIAEDPLLLPDCNHDPLALNENSMNPPTPGSNLENEESLLVEVINDSDYSEWSGDFNSHEGPIVHLQNVNGKFLVCASESGKVYKYHLKDGKLAAVFSKHTEICNSLLFDDRGSIYTVSSDGFLHKIKFKTFNLVGSENFNEPLQVIEKSRAGIYVGTKSGSIFRLKTDLTERETEPICNLGALILCLRATKEGSRNILLVSSRTNGIQVRDASDGLLLRTLSNDLVGVSIYDMLIEGSTIYCGSNRHEIFTVDFTTGALKKSRPCGAGAICVKLYKNHLIAACYDGNIYIFNTLNEEDAVNICGPSNMLLAMDLWDDKIIASTKDKTLKIMNIPT